MAEATFHFKVHIQVKNSKKKSKNNLLVFILPQQTFKKLVTHTRTLWLITEELFYSIYFILFEKLVQTKENKFNYVFT